MNMDSSKDKKLSRSTKKVIVFNLKVSERTLKGRKQIGAMLEEEWVFGYVCGLWVGQKSSLQSEVSLFWKEDYGVHTQNLYGKRAKPSLAGS